jgi:hypothetical protein
VQAEKADQPITVTLSGITILPVASLAHFLRTVPSIVRNSVPIVI